MFGGLFKKSPEQLIKKGESYLAAKRFAEARTTFQEALEKLAPDAPEIHAVRGGIAEAGDNLALMNIEEAGLAVNIGESIKAREHLRLARELAEDVTIREKAEIILNSLGNEAEPAGGKKASHGCGACVSHGGETHDSIESGDHALSPGERFELAVHTLPGDLPRRYLELGEEFAFGYLKSLDGDDIAAMSILRELLKKGESDILIYECALVHHRQGDEAESERLLRQALRLNPANPLCRMTLVELLAQSGRFPEAIGELEKMIEQDIMLEQARLFLADMRQATGDIAAAIDLYSQMLPTPLGKAAAERLVPLLQETGRTEDAKALAKRFLKGCC